MRQLGRKPSRTLSTRISGEMYSTLVALERNTDRSVGWHVRKAVTDYIGRLAKEQKVKP